jgi:hypothetical protein
MDAKKELKKWKNDFANAGTEQEKSEHKRRFKAFINSLSPSDRKEFVTEYKKGAIHAMEEADRLVKIAERKKKLDGVLDFTSMSYIAEHYFGKSRQWLYQRINGNTVNGKPADFTQEELNTFSFALSELGDQLKKASVALQ